MPIEAEEAVLSDRLEFAPNEREEEAEPRFGLVGTTKRGRVLFVVVPPRNTRVRVVTAYPASPRMIEALAKHRGGEQ